MSAQFLKPICQLFVLSVKDVEVQVHIELFQVQLGFQVDTEMHDHSEPSVSGLPLTGVSQFVEDDTESVSK